MKPSIFDIQHLHLKDYLFKLFPSGEMVGKEFVIGDIHGNKGKSLSFNIEKGCGQDFATGQVFKNIVDLVREKFNLDELAAFRKVEEDWRVSDKIVKMPEKKQKPKFNAVPFNPSTQLDVGNKYGEVGGCWLYTNGEGKGLMWIVRFDAAQGRKQFKPFIYGDDNKWHEQAWDKPRPIYNLKAIKENAEDIIVVAEGEKAADAAGSLLNLPSTTWPFGATSVALNDWTPLAGRKILIWRDNDAAGIKAEGKLAEILLDLGCTVRVFNEDAFADRPDGWDAADLAKDEFSATELREWVRLNIREYQRGGADDSASTVDDEKSAQVSEEPLNRHYRCLGMVDNKFALYNYHSGRVNLMSADAFTKKYLISLVCGATSHWRTLLKIGDKEGAIPYDSVVGILARDCYRLGQFDTDRIRGLGCWLDNNRIVFNGGNFLYVEGKEIPINDFESYYVYTRSTPIVHGMKKEVERHELEKLAKLCNMFSWEYPVCGNLLAGWLMVAPICGALSWRPHIYITGMAGTGKSTIHDNLLARVLGNCSIVTLGDSTKAGLAQSTMADALPIIFDEIENDSKFDEMRNDMVLRMARYSSSSQKGKTLKGRADQSGAEGYVSRSCFCFSSITPSVKHYADFTRITLLPLVVQHEVTKEQQIAHYKLITGLIRELMGDDTNSVDFSERFITYANRNVLKIIGSYKIIKETAHLTIPNFNPRIADQVGMLLAGYWAYKSDQIITHQEAENILKLYDWEDLVPNKKQENQMQLISRIMQHKVHFRNEDKDDTRQISRTIADLIDYVSYPENLMHKDSGIYKRKRGEDLLKNLGIIYELENKNKFLLVSNTSMGLSEILNGTQWAADWKGSLKAIRGAYTPKAPKWFGNAVGLQRYTAIPLDVILGTAPQED